MLKDQLLALAFLLPFVSAPTLEVPAEKGPIGKPIIIKAPLAPKVTPPSAKPEPAKAEPAKPEPTKTEPKTTTKTIFGTDVSIGAGPLLQSDQFVEIHVLVTDSGGKELLNTRKRGLSLTVPVSGSDFICKILDGMRQGGSRRATLAPNELNEGRGLPPFIPAGVQSDVTVWVLRTVKVNR
ncbi:MAG: hypothetical protein ABL949_16070 [Fimbriimonadaceae bacterium]